nr:hypothetical protein [Tanacetum cinerariifolium]
MNQNYFEPNLCYNSNSFDFYQFQLSQYPVVHQPPQEIKKCIALLRAEEKLFKVKQALEEEQNQPEIIQELLLQLIYDLQLLNEIQPKQAEEKGINKQAQKKLEEKSIEELLAEEQESIISTNTDIFETPPSIVITTSPPVLPIEDPEVSLIMGNEELNTIPEKESDEFIKSTVEDLVPIPKKVVTFSIPLFNSNDDFISSDDESLSDEDVPEDSVKIYSNPLFKFDDEYISSDTNPLFDMVLEDNECKDSFDPNLDEPDLLVTPIFDANKDECFDSRGDDDEINVLDCEDVTPLFDANKDECFDSRGDDDEINVLDCEDGYYDSEGDILYLESLLNDDLVHRDLSIPAMSVVSILEGPSAPIIEDWVSDSEEDDMLHVTKDVPSFA